MPRVYNSAKTAFSTVLEDNKNRVENDMAIYGPGSTKLTIITDNRGERPNCSKKGPISESDVLEGTTGNGINSFEGRNYTLTQSDNYTQLLKSATKDDLYLFATLANPTILNDESVKTSFYDRLSGVQSIEIAKVLNDKDSCDKLLKEQADEKAQFEEFFGLVEGAVMAPQKDTFYPKGHDQTEDSSLEITQ